MHKLLTESLSKDESGILDQPKPLPDEGLPALQDKLLGVWPS